jgi:hypothetical protein
VSKEKQQSKVSKAFLPPWQRCSINRVLWSWRMNYHRTHSDGLVIHACKSSDLHPQELLAMLTSVVSTGRFA